MVSSKELLQMVRLALGQKLGNAVDVSKSHKQKEYPYTAMDVLAPPAEESVEDVLGAPMYSWQDRVPKLPQSLPALIQDADVLQISSKRASVLKRIPLFAEIQRVPTNTAPQIPPGETEKMASDPQVRDAMRVLATAKILHEHEHVLDSLESKASSAQSLFDIRFALLASLSFAIERSHRQAVNKAHR